ncbi:deoxyribose-phosphate aldolase [Alysiella filiformis]|uniref:Deoxyribose-phosphate aldolase n=1 Tax=Alysiella filiformis DSM 16848 TaxID=1120981 RepID=A0A286E6E1_9NEIS|nr:deoxyribose-phosphate aldolase [Alysiella filiformis]QMT31474.1 deoxyribose-phosphate aldolase [Alysiella filiformis]UBQ55515.1 deoxyribose-phosphate aldolase [Alysiella filiformis DSM 16848]SOD66434.1 deoxyribose-phosphate aldolase [Alysiella filiformis DSM 16848]
MFTKNQIVQVMDLTSLNETDTPATIIALCDKARNALGDVAAVCVYLPFVALAKSRLPETVAVATVVNFPTGDEPAEQVIADTQQALQDGANEIDMVFPYRAFQQGQAEVGRDLTAKIAQICHEKGAKLKVILETGALNDEEIAQIAQICIQAGADFLKTSTGKIPQGASLNAAAILLQAIQKSGKQDGVGIKLSGGVREIQAAHDFMQQAADVFGTDWVQAKTFRIGASALLDNLLKN